MVTLIAGRLPPPAPPPRYATRILPPPPIDAMADAMVTPFASMVRPFGALLRPPPRYATVIFSPPIDVTADVMVKPTTLILPPLTDDMVTPFAGRLPPPPPPPPYASLLRPPPRYVTRILPPPPVDAMVTSLPPPPSPFAARLPPPLIDAMADTMVPPWQTETDGPRISSSGMLTFLQHEYDSVRRGYDVARIKVAVLDALLKTKMAEPSVCSLFSTPGPGFSGNGQADETATKKLTNLCRQFTQLGEELRAELSGNSQADEILTEELTNLCRQFTQLGEKLRQFFNQMDGLMVIGQTEYAEKPAKDELVPDNNWKMAGLEGKLSKDMLMPGNKRKRGLPIKNDGEFSSSQSLRRSVRLRRSALMPGNNRKRGLPIKNDGESSSLQFLRRSVRLQRSARL